MRLLLDQGLPRSAASILREKQIERHTSVKLDMSRASDESIISYALQQRKHLSSDAAPGKLLYSFLLPRMPTKVRETSALGATEDLSR